MNTLHTQLKNPKLSNMVLLQQPPQKSLTHSSSPLYWSLKEKHTRPLDLFMTLLAQRKLKRHNFMRASCFDQLLPLTNYNSKSTPNLLVIMEIQKPSFISSSNSLPLHFSQHHIYFSSPCPFAPLKSLYQSPCRAVNHTAHKKSPLSSQDCAPSLKSAHQDPSIITYKTTKQIKNKKITSLAPFGHHASSCLHPQKTFDTVFRLHLDGHQL